MAERKIEIDPDIRRARTPPKEIYGDPHFYELQKERVFARTWHYACQADGLDTVGRVRPFKFLEGCIDEPLLLVRDTRGELHCLSNVCTHRGNLIVEGEWEVTTLRCRYHGRRFHLDGTFAFMPGFEQCEHFPTERDYLPKVPVAAWRGLVFTGLAPVIPAAEMIAPVERRLEGLAVTEWKYDAAAAREYVVEANWALYLENYLEGFHIPFIHAALNEKLDAKTYRTETWAHGSVQIGPAAPDEPCFELPAGHPDQGQRIAAWYFWLFPGTLLNVYPWGLSLNVLQPMGPMRTRVRFFRFISDPTKLGQGAGGDLHQVEMEDEAVVQATQIGVRSRLYRGGRYSPQHEQGVHHFHRMLASWMAGGTG